MVDQLNELKTGGMARHKIARIRKDFICRVLREYDCRGYGPSEVGVLLKHPDLDKIEFTGVSISDDHGDYFLTLYAKTFPLCLLGDECILEITELHAPIGGKIVYDLERVPPASMANAHVVAEVEAPSGAGPDEVREQDPTGRNASDPGAKLDAGKVLAGVLGDFSHALIAVAEVGTYGANKYSRGGWQHVPNADERYMDALWRHLLEGCVESIDVDSGLMHAAHMAWNSLARLELMLRETAADVESDEDEGKLVLKSFEMLKHLPVQPDAVSIISQQG